MVLPYFFYLHIGFLTFLALWKNYFWDETPCNCYTIANWFSILVCNIFLLITFVHYIVVKSWNISSYFNVGVLTELLLFCLPIKFLFKFQSYKLKKIKTWKHKNNKNKKVKQVVAHPFSTYQPTIAEIFPLKMANF